MISSLTIQGVATFASAAVFADLKTINYIFGANGSGKTTISRVIGNAAGHPTCAINWQPVTQLD
jgi:predicted ATPase